MAVQAAELEKREEHASTVDVSLTKSEDADSSKATKQPATDAAEGENQSQGGYFVSRQKLVSVMAKSLTVHSVSSNMPVLSIEFYTPLVSQLP